MHNMPPDLTDISVITTGIACTCIADHMAVELQPTAPPLHYIRPLRGAGGSGEGVPWGEAAPPCGQRYMCRRSLL